MHHHRHPMDGCFEMIHGGIQSAALAPSARLALEVGDVPVDASSAIAAQRMDGWIGDAKVGAQRIQAGMPTCVDLFLSPVWALDLWPGKDFPPGMSGQPMNTGRTLSLLALGVAGGVAGGDGCAFPSTNARGVSRA